MSSLGQSTSGEVAINRYSTAKAYQNAAKMIFQNPQYSDRAISCIFPMHMLVGFAIELYLKAWLLGAGQSPNAVQKFGHNIDGLLKDATANGLPNISKLDEVAALFAGPHVDFTYRYADSGTQVDIANWLAVFPVIDRLDFEVDKFIGASTSKGLQPGH